MDDSWTIVYLLKIDIYPSSKDITGSPTLRLSTDSPTDSMYPEHSRPIGNGVFWFGYFPASCTKSALLSDFQPV